MFAMRFGGQGLTLLPVLEYTGQEGSKHVCSPSQDSVVLFLSLHVNVEYAQVSSVLTHRSEFYSLDIHMHKHTVCI